MWPLRPTDLSGISIISLAKSSPGIEIAQELVIRMNERPTLFVGKYNWVLMVACAGGKLHPGTRYDSSS